MGTSWGALLYGAAIAMLVIALPGALIGLAARLRGLWLAGVTPLLGVSAIALTSLWTALVGIHWAWWAVVVTAILIGAVVYGLTSLAPRPRQETVASARGWRWAAPIGIALGFVLNAVRVGYAIGAPGWFDQAGDNIFHLNAVQWILDNGDASPIDVTSGLDPTSRAGFYPTGWHAAAALVSQISGTPVPVASNAVLIAVACGVWPLGAVLLARTFFGSGTALLIAAGAISAGFATYPLLLIPYMGTYPLVFAIALLPAALASVAGLLGIARVGITRVVAGLILTMALLGIGLAHPSAVVMLSAVSTPLVIAALWRWGRNHRDRRSLAGLVAILYLVAVMALVIFVRSPSVQPGSARSSTGQALGEVLTGGFVGGAVPVVLAGMTIVGVVVALRSGRITDIAAVGVWVTASLIYIAAASNDEFVRLLFSNPWYGDATRVAAFTPIAIVPLAARGAEAAWLRTCDLVVFDAYPVRKRVAQITAVVLLGFTMVQSTAARDATGFMRIMFAPTDNMLISPVPLSTDDRALLAHVAGVIPPTGVIAGDPWTGASFAYALTGRRVLVPQMLEPVTGAAKVFYDGISTSKENGPACRAARALGVEWVIELNGGRTLPNRPHYAGLTDLARSTNMRLVDRVGHSSLYKIVGCGFGQPRTGMPR